MQKTWVQSVGQEDLLEKKMATQLQYSSLGNPMDRGAQKATVYRVAELDMQTNQTNHQTKPTKPPPLQINNGMIVSGEE